MGQKDEKISSEARSTVRYLIANRWAYVGLGSWWGKAYQADDP